MRFGEAVAVRPKKRVESGERRRGLSLRIRQTPNETTIRAQSVGGVDRTNLRAPTELTATEPKSSTNPSTSAIVPH
jgi:hypothetical protein